MTSTEIATAGTASPRPLYRQVEAYVRTQIRQGELLPGKRLDAGDLARKTKISRPVVQQALQSLSSQGVLIRRPRSGTYVAEDATDRMQTEDVRLTASRNLALVVPHIRIPEFSRLAHGLDDAARDRGLDLVIAGTDNSLALYEKTIRRHLESNAFGLILVPPFFEAMPLGLLRDIEASGVPTVCCYRRAGDERWPLVAEDGEYAGRIVAEHLIGAGRKRLVFVNSLDQSQAGSRFFHGFSRVVMQNLRHLEQFEELTVQELVGVRDWNKTDTMLPAIREFMEIHPGLDGFFCGSDMLADAVYHVLTEMGRSIPGDVTVVGNGGNADYYSTFGRQGLITIDYDYKQFGEELLNQLSLAGGQRTLSNFEPVYIKGELRAIEPGSTTSF